MNRLLDQYYAEELTRAMEFIPDNILKRVADTNYLFGVNPIWVGLHTFDDNMADDADYADFFPEGMRLSDTCHCAYPEATSDHSTTIVSSTKEVWYWWGAIHEIGHALHNKIDFDCNPVPIDEYAQVNYHEAFAESFAHWCVGLDRQEPFATRHGVLVSDHQTLRLFEQLAETSPY